MTVEWAGDTLAQYRVTCEADGHHPREVDEPRLYATGHASPRPFLSPSDEVEAAVGPEASAGEFEGGRVDVISVRRRARGFRSEGPAVAAPRA